MLQFCTFSSFPQVVQFHPNGKYIATGSSDHTCRLWDIHSGQCVRLFTGKKVRRGRREEGGGRRKEEGREEEDGGGGREGGRRKEGGREEEGGREGGGGRKEKGGRGSGSEKKDTRYNIIM